jgi:hypothetical protein
MKILLITPPLLQPNTPYAATPLLSAWLKKCGHETVQADLSIRLLLRLFSREGVEKLCEGLEVPEELAISYSERIEEVMAFLQNRSPESAQKLVRRGYLPEGAALFRAYEQEEELGWNFRGLDTEDRARHLASLFLDDLAEAAGALDPHFGFSRYAEKLAASLPHFSPLQQALEEPPGLLGSWLDELTQEVFTRVRPDLVALTVPFPGTLLGALRIARRIRQLAPQVPIALGGGYVNTELRELTDPAIFDFVDFITLDSGFLPLQHIAENAPPVRTFVREKGRVVWKNSSIPEIPHDQLPPPDFTGLNLSDYFGMFEMLNPATRLWSDDRWNKLILAHGCCWARCAFCDTSIDYICRYDPATPATICDWIETTLQKTGFNGFHFVDESLPPALLDPLCDEILRRNLQIEWWGNIRFEKRLSPALIQKMAAAGCIAVTGGLETACDRTLRLMQKGIRMQDAEKVLEHFSNAGILTHAYLMYGFPTQTAAETLQALETIRDFFDRGILHSAHWHRFALTAHSQIAHQPQAYNIQCPPPPEHSFAFNEIPFSSSFDHDLDAVGSILKTATYNYMLGLALDLPASHFLAENKMP